MLYHASSHSKLLGQTLTYRCILLPACPWLQSTTSGTADADVTDAASAKLVLTDWLARLACSPPAMAALLPSGAFAQAIDALEAAGGMEQVGGPTTWQQSR